MRVEIKEGDIMHTLSINPGSWAVFVDDVLVKLSRKEYLLFKLLGSCAGTAVSNEYIAASLYGTLKPSAYVNSRAVACHLRKKLSVASGGRNYVAHCRQAGYMLA